MKPTDEELEEAEKIEKPKIGVKKMLNHGTRRSCFVANPKTGIQRWVSGIDINSLYPSVIRALNMSPETIIVAQLEPTHNRKDDW